MSEASKSEKEDSDEGQAFQSGEDYRNFKAGGVNNGFAFFMNNPICCIVSFFTFVLMVSAIYTS